MKWIGWNAERTAMKSLWDKSSGCSRKVDRKWLLSCFVYDRKTKTCNSYLSHTWIWSFHSLETAWTILCNSELIFEAKKNFNKPSVSQGLYFHPIFNDKQWTEYIPTTSVHDHGHHSHTDISSHGQVINWGPSSSFQRDKTQGGQRNMENTFRSPDAIRKS